MRNQHRASFIVIGGVGIALLLSGCPKKVETVNSGATVQEEKVTPSSEAGKPGSTPLPASKVEETSVAKEVELPSQKLADAYFDFDKYTIRDDARAELENDARWLKSNPKLRVRIEGHCDERGTTEYNLVLGERRAQASKKFLSALGIDAGRLATISYGKERLVCKEHNEGCYAKNRRAHLVGL